MANEPASLAWKKTAGSMTEPAATQQKNDA
jgi:hypothetical protein